MSQMIKVSIIVPVYNAEKYLAETIDSIKNQTFASWDCILLNDGSSDKSESVALKNIKNDSRFRYIYQENTGVCVARNNAIKLSQGEYVLCLDADDLISENFLDETIKVLESDPTIKIASSKVNYFGRKKGTMKVVSYDMNTLLAANQIVVTSLFCKEDFNRIGGFNENMKNGLEDWDFWISLLKGGGRIECAQNATFYYRLIKKSRNANVSGEKIKQLRHQLWLNHKELFSQYFVNPTDCFEYLSLRESPEYKVGIILLRPIRYLLSKFTIL